MTEETTAPAPRVTRTRNRTRQPAEDQANAALNAQAPAAEAPIERPSMRTDIRPEFREDPREAAERRAREILDHGGINDIDATDEFFIPKHLIPDGWTYEWKRNTVNGMADPAYEVALGKTGWLPVPAKRHPEMMPDGWKGDTILRKGQILMERPTKITDMVLAADARRARLQVKVKEEQLSSAPKDQLPRSGDADGDPRTKPVIRKSYEPMPVPKE